jgi:hypothetical protein
VRIDEWRQAAIPAQSINVRINIYKIVGKNTHVTWGGGSSSVIWNFYLGPIRTFLPISVNARKFFSAIYAGGGPVHALSKISDQAGTSDNFSASP